MADEDITAELEAAGKELDKVRGSMNFHHGRVG
jgi:hypothetical protein